MYASVADVAVELGRPVVSPETEQIAGWIGRVEGRIQRRIPDLAGRYAIDPDVFGAALVGVVVDVVARKVRNPDGLRSERVDDYYYDRGSQVSDLSLTDDEWGLLLPESAGGAFTIRPTFAPDRRCRPW